MEPGRNKLPSKKKIADYWSDKVEAFGVFDSQQAELPENECWACGNAFRVQRCHIVAYVQGGKNEANNLVLLCASCHLESETLPPDTFWRWIRQMRQKNWKAPVLHSLQRMENYGYSLKDALAEVGSDGIDAVKRRIAAALGVDRKEKLQ